MKVLLVNPNQYKEPLGPLSPIGLDYLAAALKSKGHEIKFVDLHFCKDDQLFDLIGDFKPGLVGITIRNTETLCLDSPRFLPRIKELIQKLKRAGFAKIVVGGAGFSSMAKACFEFLELADFGIAGEGEFALLGLIREIEQGQSVFETPGVLYWGPDGVVENPRAFGELKELPPQTRQVVDNRQYYGLSPFINIQTKRGCSMQCSYCPDPVAGGHRVRFRNPKDVADEFESLLAQGVQFFAVVDSEFNIPPAHALAVCNELIQRKLPVQWYCTVRCVGGGSISEELVRAMKEAGCREVDIAVDTLVPEVANLNHLGHQNTEGLMEARRLFKAQGIKVLFGSLLGIPGQGPKELEQTLKLIERADPDVAYFHGEVRIMPGTPLESMALKEGILEPGWNPLVPVFYKPEYVKKELIPVIQKYLRKHRKNWVFMDLPMGEVLSDFIKKTGMHGPTTMLFEEMFKKPLWVIPRLIRAGWRRRRAKAANQR